MNQIILRRSNRKRKSWMFLALALISLSAAVQTVLAGNVNISVSELTFGTTTTPSCTQSANIEFEQIVSGSANETLITRVDITGIAASCDGEVVALEILGTGGTLLDEIIWTLDLDAGDTSITLRADGSSTSGGSNISEGSVSINFPASQSDPEGLASDLLARNVVDVQIVVLQGSRAALE
jgi:hypothetical protein